MNRCNWRRPTKVLPVLLAICFWEVGSVPALAGALGYQAQMQYDFVEAKERGLPATGRGRFSTNYSLTLRRPFLPTSTLVSDLTFNATGNGDYNTVQNTRGWALNLYSNASRYMLNGRVTHNNYSSGSGSAGTSTGSTTDYNLGLFLRQPAYPVVNLQFQRNVSGSSYAGARGSYATTTWLSSGYYERAPFRVSVDRTRQSFGLSGVSGSVITTQVSRVTMDHTLLPGLLLTGEASKSVTDVSYTAGGGSNSNVDRRIIRLRATPMRSLVADIDFTSQSSNQNVGLFSSENNDRSVSWSIRSQILPQVSLDVGDQRQSQSASAYLGTGWNVSRIRNLALAARVADGTTFNLTTTRTVFDGGSIVNHADQDSLQAALQTMLTNTTDMSLYYGRSTSNTGTGDSYVSRFQGVSIRDHRSSRVSSGVSYRQSYTRSEASSTPSTIQNGDAVDVDMLWQPNYAMGLNLRLSYQNNRGSGAYKTIAPSANVRWQVNGSTSLIANYTSQQVRQFDATNALSFGQNTKGLSLRLTHSLTSASNLDASYDFQSNNFTNTEWRRQLRFSYTARR